MAEELLNLRCSGAADFFKRFSDYCSDFDLDVSLSCSVIGIDKISFKGPLSSFPGTDDHSRLLEALDAMGTMLKSLDLQFGIQQHAFTFSFRFVDFDGYSLPLRFPADKALGSCLTKLRSHFDLIAPKVSVSEASSIANDRRVEVANAAVNHISDLLAKLSDLHVRSIADSKAFIEQTTKTLEATRTESETKFQAEIAEKLGRIAAAEAEVQRKESELNLRESRGVRRDLLNDIKTLASEQKSFERSKETGRQGHILMGVSITLLLFGLGLIVVSLVMHEPSKMSVAVGSTIGVESALNPYVPFGSGAFLVGTTAIFFLRHLRLVYSRSEDTDFSIMQFHRDVLRMSWVTELVFEAKNNRVENENIPVDLPEVLLEQFSRSLFAFSREQNTPHPIDDLQQMARRFKRFSIGSKGIEVEAKSKEPSQQKKE